MYAGSWWIFPVSGSSWVGVCVALSWGWFPVSILAVPSVYTTVAALLPCPWFAGEALRLTAMVMELVPYLWPCPGLQTSLFPWDHPPLAIACWSLLFLLAVKVIQLPLHPLLVFCWFEELMRIVELTSWLWLLGRASRSPVVQRLLLGKTVLVPSPVLLPFLVFATRIELGLLSDSICSSVELPSLAMRFTFNPVI